MLSRRLGGFLAAALYAVGAQAEALAAQACRSDLVVDNFSKFYDAVNSLGDATSGKARLLRASDGERFRGC